MYFEEKQNHDSKDHFIIAAQKTDQQSVQFYFTALKIHISSSPNVSS